MKHLRKKSTTFEKLRQQRPPRGSYVAAPSGTFIPPYGADAKRWKRPTKYDGDDPWMIAAFREPRRKRGWHMATTKEAKKKNVGKAHCTAMTWALDNLRDFGADHCLLMPNMRPGVVVRVRYNYKEMAAARAMLIATQGLPEKPDAIVTHKCGNGHLSCINPTHLAWGDAKQNAQDKVLHDLATEAVEVSDETRSAIKASEGMPQVIAWQFRVPVSQVIEIQARSRAVEA